MKFEGSQGNSMKNTGNASEINGIHGKSMEILGYHLGFQWIINENPRILFRNLIENK